MAAARDGWLIPPDPELDLDGEELDRMDDLRRMLFHFHVEDAVVRASRRTKDPGPPWRWFLRWGAYLPRCSFPPAELAGCLCRLRPSAL